MTQDYFSGCERIAIFKTSGRTKRTGAPDELAGSNYGRVQQALAADDTSKAAEYAALQRSTPFPSISVATVDENRHKPSTCQLLLAITELVVRARKRPIDYH